MVERAPADRLGLSVLESSKAGKEWWGNFLRNPDAFDLKFFKKSSREAVAWDPQQRMLLEVVYEALESSGYFSPSAKSEPKDYGCYIGAIMNNYYDNVSCNPPTAYATVGTSRCFLSGCTSHYFGWTGPSLTIDTACSSSLVAINAACKAILSGECSRAIAGGTNVITSPFDYQNLNAAGFLSPSGQCKPFDAGADGYCRGEGVSVVVLKPLAAALEENHNILGVIVGSAVNQNPNHSHITVPNSGAQTALYRKVIGLSGMESEAVSYVEAHGTGTVVGDPIECQSIREAFGGPSRDGPLYFSSIKGNIGHTEATAGVSGLVKVLLMMQHEEIPPQASYSSLNRKIPALEPDRMEIPRSLVPWKSPVRLACVNSYGAAGSNSAVMVREKPTTNIMQTSDTSIYATEQLARYPLIISAASGSSLAMYCQKLRDWLENIESQSAADNLVRDLTFNLADRANHKLPHVLSIAVADVHDVKRKLAAAVTNIAAVTAAESKPVVLVFGGQERDFIGLSEGVYHSSVLFRYHLDACNEILVSHGHTGLYPAVFQRGRIADLVTLHAALFSVQYASAKSWMDCGLEISAVIGHSFGQLTALCIASVLSLADALKLVAGRAAIMLKHWGSEPGSMLCLHADRQKVMEVLAVMNAQESGDQVEVACYNGPHSHVVVGSNRATAALEIIIANSASFRNSVRTERLNVTHGFHSMFITPLLLHITALAKELTWMRPTIHLETCDETGKGAEPDFRTVAEHTRRPVFFQQAVERLRERWPQSTWLEAGRGSSVIQLVKGSLEATQGNMFLSPQLTTPNAQDSLRDATIELWKAGYSVQYWHFHRRQKSQYRHLSLPSYQFEKSRHWLPFKDRSAREDSASVVQEKTSPTDELLSYLRFKDDTKNEAIFHISPSSERFKAILNGHVMAGQCVAPASLYFEVAARAALFLVSDAEAATHVPTVENLHINSPIGQDTNKEILLHVKRTEDVRPSWSFSITVGTPPTATGPAVDTAVQSTGTVLLRDRSDARQAQEFKRFESLIGRRRHEEIIGHAEAESMQGSHIYRAFSPIVQYSASFQGIKRVACVGLEAASKVSVHPDADEPADQRLTDTPMMDSFMQLAGILVNYFNNASLDDILVCFQIDHIEIGGRFTPDAKEWIVYANMTNEGEREALADVYVFEAGSNRMVMAAFGFHFSRVARSVLGRLLRGEQVEGAGRPAVETSAQLAPETRTLATQKPSSARAELLQILHNVTDIPLEELTDESTLEELGIDSLGATEVLNDIRQGLGLSIDLSTFLFFPDIHAMVAYIDETRGLGFEVSHTYPTKINLSGQSILTPNGHAGNGHPVSIHATPDRKAPSSSTDRSSSRALIFAYDIFKDMRFGYDEIAARTSDLDFWSCVYPDQARLVLAYVVEAYAELGCDMNSLASGEAVPAIQALPMHKQLVQQLYRVLEDGNLIAATTDGFVRTAMPVGTRPADTIFADMYALYPRHASVHKLIQVVGSDMASCLRGDKNGLQLMFGTKENKRALEDIYENWPLIRTPTILLGDFLLKTFQESCSGNGPFRILEVGAGTGGTTRYIVDHLRRHGIPFEYTFTDISASLVATARKAFAGCDDMSFEVLDIEKPPSKERSAYFHVVTATNCIHATRNLNLSLSNLRKIIRPDGVLSLIEMTTTMFWLDVVVGLFEGWWLFEDGREYALVGEEHWAREMERAGFEAVLWSDGESREAKTVRVISAFAAGPANNAGDAAASTGSKGGHEAAWETVVYKKFGDTEIHADVYYPPQSTYVPAAKMPIALMIHGGSHIIFSRKDIRPAQTRLLLERGFLPVSLDHRLCPEVSLSEGPMVDVCDALEWARYTLPRTELQRPWIQPDGERVVVVGWSSGGQLAMSLAWTAPQRGLRPPEAVLAFYCPTDYEDPWWRSPIQPVGAEDQGMEYDLLEAVQDEPITNYTAVGAWEPLSDPRIRSDPRCHIVLHMNWKAQTLPIIVSGLPSRSVASAAVKSGDVPDWKALAQPDTAQIVAVSPRAHIVRGEYETPTFLVHGTADDLIPWQQSQETYRALRERGIQSGLALVEGGPHVCDSSSDAESESWKATLRGYEFICSVVGQKAVSGP
ncbi:BcPKS19, polyketide synthase [Massariosphaeria phaeospora]|uniref:BcPKS19, polyketide synthase n=1 Tax=Massariosphaeria phaeospora TaxID=100035 RepID=A0A7C8M6L1_9PLEO|nr:BcPKS19, polyketide synthase [Massariosphaeria phaeospora]